MPQRLYAAVEAGGTKFNLAVGTADGELVFEQRIATGAPDETLDAVAECFRGWNRAGAGCAGLGIGSFGPLDLDRDSPRWGFITSTPKPGWRQTDLAGRLARDLGLPTAIDTDVNAALLWEAAHGAAAGCANAAYVTVGTGIGGGALADGRLLHGRMHPEMGHMPLRRHPDDAYPGCCPYHGDCAEGLASGPALAARWGRGGQDLPADHPGWDIEAWYLAQVALNIQLVLSPEAIVFGGGMFQNVGLVEKVRRAADSLSGGYLDFPNGRADWSRVVRPAASDRSGLLGALLLAAKADREA